MTLLLDMYLISSVHTHTHKDESRVLLGLINCEYLTRTREYVEESIKADCKRIGNKTFFFDRDEQHEQT